MDTKTYSVKQIATILDVECHVLRYYEKELELKINRNEQGHRAYNDEDIDLFRRIINYTEQGLKLKAVHKIIHGEEETNTQALVHIDQGMVQVEQAEQKAPTIDIGDLENSKIQLFAGLIKDNVIQGLAEYNQHRKEEIKGEIKEELSEELAEEVNYIINKKIREVEVDHVEKSEEYYNRIDEVMREMQKLRREMAELEGKKDKEGFGRNYLGVLNLSQ